MKKIYRLALLLTAFLTYACVEKPQPEPEPEPEPVVEPVTLQLTFVLPEGAEKSAWVAGDEIVVHGEYAAQQVVVKLSAADIKDDGKSASLEVEGLYPYEREDCASSLYAAYPASCVDNLKHCFFYSKFNTTSSEILAACNDASNTFHFQQLLSKLCFNTGDEVYDSFTIMTTKKENLGYGFMQVKLTDKEQNLKQYAGDPILELDLASGKADNTVYLPANTDISKGFTIKFRKNGDFVKAYYYKEALAFEGAQTIDLGNISAEVKDYVNPFSDDVRDLDTNGNANCYIVTEPGKYKFKAVLGNISTSFFEDVADAVVLWETWNNAEEVVPGSVVASATFAEDYIIIKTPDELHPGNAVVAARKESGEIMWSWHIWIPQVTVTSDSYGDIMGAPLMNLNLGALVETQAAAEPVDPLSYGLVYQWGRKDPFVNSHTALKNTLATWAGADEEVAPGQISLADAIANPRLLGHINDGNWMDKVDETLWSDTEKTIYDPCPPGYRVPARNTNKPFWGSNLTSAAGWAVDGVNGWLTIGEPKAVFPIAGYRDDYSVSGMAKVGARTLYWTAHGSEAKAAGADLRYDKSSFKLGSAPKARLGSVRCVTE